MANSEQRPLVGVAVFIWRDDKVLLIQRSGSHGQGQWAPPGGYLEFGESFEGAAHRETKEEVGCRICNVGYLAVTNTVFAEEGKHSVVVWMKSNWMEGDPRVMEPHKIAAIGWYSLAAPLPEPLFQPFHDLRAVNPTLFMPPTP